MRAGVCARLGSVGPMVSPRRRFNIRPGPYVRPRTASRRESTHSGRNKAGGHPMERVNALPGRAEALDDSAGSHKELTDHLRRVRGRLWPPSIRQYLALLLLI